MLLITDLLESVKLCLEDDSLYVSKAACSAIAVMLLCGAKHQLGYNTTNGPNACLKIMEYLIIAFQRPGNISSCRLSNCLRILCQVSHDAEITMILCENFGLHNIVHDELSKATSDKDVVDLADILLSISKR